MKKITMAFVIILLSSFSVSALGITIKSGTTFTLNGIAKVTGDFTNQGTVSAGTGTIEFNGDVGNQYVFGQSFFNITVNKAAGDVILRSNILVNGTLATVSGNVDLNGRNIELGGSAALNESPGAIVKGNSGYITTTRNLNAPNNLNVANMGAVLTSTADFGNTIIKRGHSSQSNESIFRYFDINPTNNFNLDATLTFLYDESELNGVAENSLLLFRSPDNGTNWIEVDAIKNAAANSVTANGINSFSIWTLAGPPKLPPELTTNTGATVDEGGVINISGTMLTANDPDGSSLAIRYFVDQDPAHGSLNKNAFTQNDLNNEGILYANDGEDFTEDSFTFHILDNDGLSSDEYTFELTINPVADLPASPTNVEFSHNEDGDIVITWTDNSGNETGFQVWRQTNSSAKLDIINEFVLIATVPANTVNYIDHDVQEGVTYTYLINAVNDEGSSETAEGEEDENETTGVAPLTTPSNLTAMANENGSITVTWDDNSLLEEGYRLTRKTGATGEYHIIADLDANVQSYIDTDVQTDNEYYYQVKAYSTDNESAYSNESHATSTITGIEDWTNRTPTEFTLFQNYPNPFNPSTSITYGIPESSNVQLVVYNMLGQKVAVLVDQHQSAGYHHVTFEASGLNSGIYIYQIRAGNFVDSKKIMLLK